jgi:hypothetical protein
LQIFLGYTDASVNWSGKRNFASKGGICAIILLGAQGASRPQDRTEFT